MKLTDYLILESAITKRVLSLWDNPIDQIAEQVYLRNYSAASELAKNIEIDASPLRNFMVATFQSCGAYGALLAETEPHFLKNEIFGTSATFLVESLKTDISSRIQQNIITSINKVQQDPSLIASDEEEEEKLILITKAPTKQDYIKEFVSFADGAEGLVQMVSGLHTSRLATWGFTQEADYLGILEYQLAAVLDDRTSYFCRHIANGKVFRVSDAKEMVERVLNAPTADAKFLQPWVRGTKANLAALELLSAEELTAMHLHIPPFHPFCRTMCLRVDSKLVVVVPAKVPDNTVVIPAANVALLLEKALKPLDKAMADYLKVKNTSKSISTWNKAMVSDAAQTISKLSNVPLQEVSDGLLDNSVSIVAGKDGSTFVKGKVKVGGGTHEFSYNFNPVSRNMRVNFINLSEQKEPVKALANQLSNVIDVAKVNAYSQIVLPVKGDSAFLMALLDSTFADMALLQKALLKKLDALNKSFPLLMQDDYEALKLMIESSNLSSVGLQSIAKYPLQLGKKHMGELLFKGLKGDALISLTDENKLKQMESFLSTLW